MKGGGGRTEHMPFGEHFDPNRLMVLLVDEAARKGPVDIYLIRIMISFVKQTCRESGTLLKNQ